MKISQKEIYLFIVALLPVDTYIRVLMVGIPIMAYCLHYIIKEIQAEIRRKEAEENKSIDYPIFKVYSGRVEND